MKFPNTIRKELFKLLLFVIAAVFLRFFSFFPSELDHDESTYMIIGNAILKGKMLYSDVTDTKPVGIFLVYAALQAVFGYSIILKRLFVAILVGITCYLVQRASFTIFKNKYAAIASGVIYLFYTSTWCYFGLSPNTELYFNLYTVSGLLFFFKGGKRAYMLAGLMMGVGFMFKYLVLFDYLAFILFFLFREIQSKKSNFKLSLFYPSVLSGIGFLFPFAATAFYFFAVGRFDDFYFISFELPGLYKASPSFIRYLTMMGDLIIRFFPITFFFFYVIFNKQLLKDKWQHLFLGMWMILVMIAIFLPGKEFSHYTIQLMLPISIVAGLFFHSEYSPKPFLKYITRGKTGLLILFAIVLMIQVVAFFDNIVKPDHYKQVAEYIQDNKNEDEIVFVSNYEPIIYYLIQQGSPTKYVHSTLLFSDLHKAFMFDNIEEIQRIMNQNPQFVLVQYENKIVEDMMGENYYLDQSFKNNEVLLYQLK